MTTPEPVQVFLVDDEPDVTRGLSWLLDSVSVPNRAFNDSAAFLSALEAHDGPACAVLDLRMPGLSGLELMERMQRHRADLPIIFLSAHGDVPSAVRAMKLGAVDFLQKPFNPQQFLDCVHRATEQARTRHADWLKQRDYGASLSLLSPRERDVLEHLLAGESSKAIARVLDISPKTVDVHRANVLRKLGAANARDLANRFGERSR